MEEYYSTFPVSVGLRGVQTVDPGPWELQLSPPKNYMRL